jgi:FtsX-like permease family protein/MacB-like protein
MASCCLLLISTAFLLSGLRAALQTSAGHRLGEPLLATVQAQTSLEQDDTMYFQQVQQAVKSVRGISESTWVEQAPGNQAIWRSFRIDPPRLPLRDVAMDIAWFTPGSLRRFTLPPRAGRLFGFQDQTCRVAIVNEEAAAELFGSAKGTDACRETGEKPTCPSGGTPNTVPVLRAFPQNTVGRVIQDSTGRPHPTIYYNHADQTGPPPAQVARARFRAPVPSELAKIQLDTNVVSPNYFDILGFPITAGRGFTASLTPGECRVAVINEEAADLYFGDKPIGAAVIDDHGVRTSIVGVVRSKPLGTFERRTEPAIYLPMRQDCPPRMTLLAATRDRQSSILSDLRNQIESVPGHGPAPVIVESLATHLAHTSLAPLRIATVIIGASATTALLLSTLGLFGALSDAARQRRRELAIHIALGAQGWRVISEILKDGGRLAGVGTVAGILASLALSRLLAHITPVNSSPSLWVWLVGPLLLTIGVVIASILPARRALLVNPLAIMRDDNS